MRRILLSLCLLLAPMAQTGCVESKKPAKEIKAAAKKYELDTVPTGIKSVNVNFNNYATLVGYKLMNKGAVKPGQKVTYKFYWRSDKKIGKGWRLFTHILGSKGKKLLNIDAVGPIREIKGGKQLLPPSAWKAGKVYEDEQTFQVPKNTAGQTLSIITGIWKGSKRQKVVGGKKPNHNRAVALRLRVKGKRKASAPRLPRLRADKLEKGQVIKIDGKLDEEAWKGAAKTGSFVNVATGKKAKESKVQGSALLTWDDKNLYLGFTVKDEDVIGGFKPGEKDPHLWTKDTVEVMIDPDGNGDNKDYYEIQVNPQNLVFDSQFDDYNQPKAGPKGPFGHQEWSAKLKSAVVVDGTLDKPGDKDKGYTVEMAIPWSSLSKAKTVPPALGDTWRMNLYAMQNNNGVAWSPIMGKGNFHKASQFGRVRFAEKGWKPPKKKLALAAASASAPHTVKTGVIKKLKEQVAKKLAAPKSKAALQPQAPAAAPAAPPAPKPQAAPKAPAVPQP